MNFKGIGQMIEKKNPLKQGLKPARKGLDDYDPPNWKEESIKTRIETKRRVGMRLSAVLLKRRIH